MNKFLLEDWRLKLKMLWLYRGNLREWWHDVAMRGSCERMCCDGRACGCYGADYCSFWKHLWTTRGKP